ncbi:hypothetical protein CHLRE_14g630350v5 [Chlamydomonas reinhardtii]|uniref:MD-2-related lipid-recognition domain-containing protein n=1 Tax=Chlamydomonas reinhardtii TaxID=3055 RepID=A0A2K3CYM4_CHLRE|nr:uncharacterized protein CHLRE_14g630350v5 [Chlamydomonas reinhardtii]PNW73384.1 hypothetical protein CHLRE_14g630350v5 [Chlamydomonas reinhardtii]
MAVITCFRPLVTPTGLQWRQRGDSSRRLRTSLSAPFGLHALLLLPLLLCACSGHCPAATGLKLVARHTAAAAQSQSPAAAEGQAAAMAQRAALRGAALRGAVPGTAVAPRTAVATRTAVAARQLPERPGRGAGTTAAQAHHGSSGGGSSSSSHVSTGGGGASRGRQLGGMRWEACGGGPAGAPMLQPDDVSMAPDPPHHGRTMDINVTGTTPLSTPGGRFQVAVSYLGVRVYTHATDLCDAMPCPLEAGTPFRLRVSQKLPMLAPPGPYTMEITGDAEAGGRFMCVLISFNLAAPGGSPAAEGPAGGHS